MQVGQVKIGDFRQITRYNLKTSTVALSTQFGRKYITPSVHLCLQYVCRDATSHTQFRQRQLILVNVSAYAYAVRIMGSSNTIQYHIYGSLRSRCGHYILQLWFLSSFFLFSSPLLSGWRLDVYHTSTHDVALARIQKAGLKCAARGSLKIQDAKNTVLPSHGHK